MKLLFEGGAWLFPLYAVALVAIFALVLTLDPLTCWLSRRKHRQSLHRVHRHRSF